MTLFFSIAVFSVEKKLTLKDTIVKGKISVENRSNHSVTIINLANKKSAVSDENGYFEIEAKPNDTLFCSGFQLDVVRHVLTEKDFKTTLFIIKMFEKSNSIETILVKSPTITAESLGLVPKGQKRYTVAERRLVAETGGFGIGGLISALNGRTKQLKAEKIIEEKDILKDKILASFDEAIFINSLKISKEKIPAFLFFVVENKQTKATYDLKDKLKLLFYLTELSVEFLKTQETQISK